MILKTLLFYAYGHGLFQVAGFSAVPSVGTLCSVIHLVDEKAIFSSLPILDPKNYHGRFAGAKRIRG